MAIQSAVQDTLATSLSRRGLEGLVRYRDDNMPGNRHLEEQAGYLGKLCFVEVGFAGLIVAALAEAVIRVIVSLPLFLYSAIASDNYVYNLAERCLNQSVGCIGVSVLSMFSLYSNFAYSGRLEDSINELVNGR